MGDVKSYFGNPKALLKLIRQIAQESGSVHIPHRSSGHIIGEIGTSLIFACLEKGRITQQQPDSDPFSNQLCELTHTVAGQEISVVLAVDVTKHQIHILHVEG
jgi:hypothetical protein